MFLQLVTQTPKLLYYKDSGGKDSSILIEGRLVDVHGVIVGNQHIPLEFKLFYYTEQQTESQELQNVLIKNKPLLNIIPESSSSTRSAQPPMINADGHFKLRFRIEDVSKNHKSQRFVLQIIPTASNIAPIRSYPIEVRSKPKRAKPEETHRTYGGQAAPVVAVAHEHPDLLVPVMAVSSHTTNAAEPVESDEVQNLHVIRSWCTFAMDSVKGVQFQQIESVCSDTNTIITQYRCPYCRAYKTDDTISSNGFSSSHHSDCRFVRLENAWNNRVVQCFAGVKRSRTAQHPPPPTTTDDSDDSSDSYAVPPPSDSIQSHPFFNTTVDENEVCAQPPRIKQEPIDAATLCSTKNTCNNNYQPTSMID